MLALFFRVTGRPACFVDAHLTNYIVNRFDEIAARQILILDALLAAGFEQFRED